MLMLHHAPMLPCPCPHAPHHAHAPMPPCSCCIMAQIGTHPLFKHTHMLEHERTLTHVCAGPLLCCDLHWEADAAQKLQQAIDACKPTHPEHLQRLLSEEGVPSALAAPGSCPEQPSDPACAAYQYPQDKAESDLDALCSAMPDMPGCSVRKACKVRGYTGSVAQGQSAVQQCRAARKAWQPS